MRYDFKTDCVTKPPSVSLTFGRDMPQSQGEVIFTVHADAGSIQDTLLAMVDLVQVANFCKVPMPLDHAVEFEGLTADDLRDFTAIIKKGGYPYPLPSEFTAEYLDQVLNTVIDPTPSELAEYAARAAINELIPNWKQALAEGSQVQDLVGDLDTVIAKLVAFKALCAVRGKA